MPIPRIVEGDGFTMTFSSHGDYLRAQVDGQHDTFEISLGYWTMISDECRARGARQLLVVENIAEPGADAVDLPQLVDAIAALGFTHIRVAFVDLIEEHMHAMEYGEILARERNITGRVFGDEASAVRWLRHGVE